MKARFSTEKCIDLICNKRKRHWKKAPVLDLRVICLVHSLFFLGRKELSLLVYTPRGDEMCYAI